MVIDIHTHIMPRKFLDAVSKYLPQYEIHRYNSVRTLWNIEERLQQLDLYPGMGQVLTPTIPLELLTSPKKAADLSRIYNDEMAALVAKYPRQFVAAVACLPLNNIDSSLKELDRAINKLGFKGIYMHTPVFNGPKRGKPMDSPEFLPLYEIMSKLALPIWIHPYRTSDVPDYNTEKESKYAISHIFGWPYETTAAMTRLVMAGVLELYPELKVITHHCGAMVPFFADRISGIYEFYEVTLKTRMSGLTKNPIEYFHLFYNDTALYGNTPALMCALAFFGVENILFGSDLPYGVEGGSKYLRNTVSAVENMPIPQPDKIKIFQANAKRLLRLNNG